MYKLGFIGVGKMGGAILDSVISFSNINKSDIIVCGRSKNEKYASLGIKTTTDIIEVLNNSEIIIIGIKPQNFEENFSNLVIDNKGIIVSIAAGIKIETLKQYFPSFKIIRVMPNLPLTIKKGMSSISRDIDVTDNELNKVINIFESSGKIVEIKEDMIDAFIPLSGSMPAFIEEFMKAFINEGVKHGFSYNDSKLMVSEAIIGTAELVKQSDRNIDEMINDVCSKGGTTIEGVTALRNHHLDETITDCFNKTYNRSIEMNNTKSIRR